MKQRFTILQTLRVLSISLAAIAIVGCAGQNFSYADAKQIHTGMTSDQVIALMKSKPNVTEVHGEETHYVWAYGNLAGQVKQMRVRFDKTGQVIGAPVVP